MNYVVFGCHTWPFIGLRFIIYISTSMLRQAELIYLSWTLKELPSSHAGMLTGETDVG